MANDTEFGLASYYCSREGCIRRVAEALGYGIVGIDAGIIPTEIAPFGGMKEGGIGQIWRVNWGSKYGSGAIGDESRIRIRAVRADVL